MATLIQNQTAKKFPRADFNGFGPSLLIQQTRGRIKRNELPTDQLADPAGSHEDWYDRLVDFERIGFGSDAKR